MITCEEFTGNVRKLTDFAYKKRIFLFIGERANLIEVRDVGKPYLF
jgi:hypothetical protein